MTNAAEALYKEYWVGEAQQRQKRLYYDRLYEKVRARLCVEENWKMLDVAGGNGQFMRYLGVARVDILDISESGLEQARHFGYSTIFGDIQKRFPIAENTYDAAFLFEVLEHLSRPNKTLTEIHNVLKLGGVLYLGQPNMRADGVHHVRRYYLRPFLTDLEKSGFRVEWIDYVPAYTMRDSILSDIQKNPSWVRKAIQCVNLGLSFLPRSWRYILAKAVPDRFALLFIIKAIKI